MQKINIHWFRRDLRYYDNTSLFHALSGGLPVLPIFIFDTHILDKLDDKSDARVTFIHQTIENIKAEIQLIGADLNVFYGNPQEIWEQLTTMYNIDTVYFNHDYEPYALARDQQIKTFLTDKNIHCKSFKDHVIFEKLEVVKDDGTPYTVFTPYKKKWLSNVATLMDQDFVSHSFVSYESENLLEHFLKVPNPDPMISLAEMGFTKSLIPLPTSEINQSVVKQYADKRDFPALDATTRLGIHFRFGTVSIRAKARAASKLSEVFLSELIWRDFYSQILYNFPHVANAAFRSAYDHIPWRNNETEFAAWCHGMTGYPIVDAGMRELNQTGHMHNRVRMITASFLTKHLLIDWRWGEAYFASRLLDFDLASNNGGWQWAAGCGTDAAPYFRIFSPDAQTDRFDKDRTYIKKWIPEYNTRSYPKPIVDHKMARERCLEVYKAALNN